MDGGSSRNRRRARRLATKLRTIQSSSASMTGYPKRTPYRGVIEIILGLILAVAGGTEVFPLAISIVLYLLALIVVWLGVGEVIFESSSKSNRRRWQIGAIVFSVFLIYFPLTEQYDHTIHLHLDFKESQHLSWWRKQVITRDISNMRDYLVSLNISVPADLPPIDVTADSNSGCSESKVPQFSLERSTIAIGESWITNRRVVTSCYVGYVVMKLITSKNFSVGNLMLEPQFTDYFDRSYWEEPPTRTDWSILFWHIRETLGKQFTDRLIAAALNAAADSSSEGRDSNMLLYWAAKIKIADFVVDSECSKWPQIEDVFLKEGVDKDRLRGQDFTGSQVSTACIQQWSK